MRNAHTRLLIGLGLLGILFLAVTLHATWRWTQAHTREMANRQAELAIAFDAAIRGYVREHIRPEMEKRVEPGEFVPEAMSTSFIARSVFDEVCRVFPDYLLRFPSTNPRNPLNLATPSERRIIEYFEKNEKATTWTGVVDQHGTRYFARAIPRRFDAPCLRCHGKPEDAPASLVARYGDVAGFHRSAGELSIDLAGIPVDRIEAAARAKALNHMLMALVASGLFIAAIAFLIRLNAREQRRAEHMLRRSETKFRTLYDSTSDAVLLLDEKGVIDCNRAALAMFGCPAVEDLRSRQPADLSPAKQPCGTPSATLAGRRIAAALENGSDRFEWLHRRLDTGQTFLTEVLLNAMQLDGKPVLQAVVRDITERKRKEAELRLTSFSFDRSDTAAIWVGRDARLLYVNEVACRSLEYTREELLSLTVHDINPLLKPEDWADHWQQIREQGSLSLQSVHRTRTGRVFPVEVTVNYLQYDGQEYSFAVVHDITERKRAEAELQEATARASRMASQAEAASAAKSQFLANMSHEIRTPMTAILGYADSLRHGDIPEAERIEAIATIQRNGQHLLQVINDILDLSKIEAEKMTFEQVPCSLHQLIAEVASLVRPRATEKGLRFDVEFVGAVPDTIRTDPLRLRQILINVIGNAVKFTHEGGVRLEVRFIAGEGGPQLQFDVIDTGVGMTDEQAERIFQPFHQADASTTRRYGGTGLGLPISKRLAQALGGDVLLVESRPGTGARFRITVAGGALGGEVRMIEGGLNAEAMTVHHRPPVETASPATRDASLAGLRILLVEDGPDNQRLIAHLLRKAGARVELADNGRVGATKGLTASEKGQPFDVILMDMQMPEMDGYEATGLLRNAGYRGPIIALTAHAMAGDEQKCLDAGCDDYATKPINSGALFALIRRYVQQPVGAATV